MIDVKSAVRTAIQYLQEFHEFIPARSLRLEETELTDDGSWLITLSTEDPDSPPVVLAPFSRSGSRIYKQFRIDADTGAVKSMKVRTLQPVE